jgi:cysteine desulfurase/selenocysteine lyase
MDSLISNRTKILAITHVSNTLGTINPVQEFIRKAHRHSVPVLVDGAQSVQHLAVNVQELDADFFVFSGHKIYGPTGIGVLYGKEKWLEQMPPWQGGGDMIETVSFKKTTFNKLPFKFEAGTSHFVGAHGLAEAIKYVQSVGLDAIERYENSLLTYATQQLQLIQGLRIIGTAKDKSGVISFLPADIHAFDAGMILDKMGIAVRTGTHCTQPIMDHFGIPGTIRASFSFYNTREEIDKLAQGITKIVQMFA